MTGWTKEVTGDEVDFTEIVIDFGAVGGDVSCVGFSTWCGVLEKLFEEKGILIVVAEDDAAAAAAVVVVVDGGADIFCNRGGVAIVGARGGGGGGRYLDKENLTGFGSGFLTKLTNFKISTPAVIIMLVCIL